jgi:hypothetical protein
MPGVHVRRFAVLEIARIKGENNGSKTNSGRLSLRDAVPNH